MGSLVVEELGVKPGFLAMQWVSFSVQIGVHFRYS